MNIHHSIRRMMAGPVLMLIGVFVTDPTGIIHRMIGSFFTDNVFQLLLGVSIIVIGFVVFVKTFDLSQRTEERAFQKSEHEIIDIFGLK